jgi:chemotaxis signal transduction protein
MTPATTVRTAGAPAGALHVIARVGSERFAFPVSDVEEAIDAPRISWVPGAAPGLAGELRYRDRTVSAFDGGWALGVSRSARGGTALIFRDGSRRLALIVDDVDSLAALPAHTVKPVPAGADGDGVLSGVWFAGAVQLVGLVSTGALLARVAALGPATAIGETQ